MEGQNQAPNQNQPQNPPSNPAPSVTPPPQKTTDYNPNNVYPTAVDDSAPLTQAAAPNGPEGNPEKDSASLIGFSSGYSMGGTIYLFQLIAGFVLGIIIYFIDLALFKSHSTTTLRLFSIILYLIVLAVQIYVAYRIVSSQNIKESFWVTIIGSAIQAVFLGITVVVLAIAATLIITRSSSGFGVRIISAQTIIIALIFIIISYFVTKIAWGICLALISKINNPVILRAIGAVVLAASALLIVARRI